MDAYLTKLSGQLAFTDEMKTRGNTTMDRVFKVLKDKSHYSLARLRPLGGVAKATSVWYKVDYDCCVYINDCVPPFKNVISEFQDILMLNFNLKEEDFKVCPRSLQFTLDGTDFDLLPATNMVPTSRSSDIIMAQHRAMFQKIKQSRDLRKAANDNSAGLSEATVEFVKRQSAFVHTVARLAKFWNTTIFYPKYVSGRSTIMETLAIKAGQEEETANRSNPSILRAFRLFLVKVRDIKNTNLAFYEFYDRDDVPDYIRGQRPLLLDTSNPCNNILHDIQDDTVRVFSKCAAETLKRVEIVQFQGFCGMVPDVYCLFEPQPPIKDFVTDMGFVLPQEWIAGLRPGSCEPQPRLIIRRRDATMPKFLDCVKLVFTANAELMRYSSLYKFEQRSTQGPQVSESSAAAYAKEKLEEFIDRGIKGKPHSPWTPCNCSHENYDVTFEIPVGAGNNQSVLISAKWGQL